MDQKLDLGVLDNSDDFQEYEEKRERKRGNKTGGLSSIFSITAKNVSEDFVILGSSKMAFLIQDAANDSVPSSDCRTVRRHVCEYGLI